MILGNVIPTSANCPCSPEQTEALLDLMDEKLIGLGKEHLLAVKYDLQRNITIGDMMYFSAYKIGLGGGCAGNLPKEDVCSGILTFLYK